MFLTSKDFDEYSLIKLGTNEEMSSKYFADEWKKAVDKEKPSIFLASNNKRNVVEPIAFWAKIGKHIKSSDKKIKFQ